MPLAITVCVECQVLEVFSFRKIALYQCGELNYKFKFRKKQVSVPGTLSSLLFFLLHIAPVFCFNTI